MRIQIRHKTTYAYAEPAKSTIQHLRLTPRNYDGQHVAQWRIDVDRDCRLRAAEDSYGNIMHRLTSDDQHTSISTLVEGEVTTFDTAGIVSGAIERFPTVFYLRNTPLTVAGSELTDFGNSIAKKSKSRLDDMHALLAALYEIMSFDTDATHATTTATTAFGLRKGVCQDFAHIFISCARVLNVPARYVSGYLLRNDTTDQVAGHAWAEVFIEDLGWIGFDPAHGVCPGERYIRLAVAPDYIGAAPIRGARMGGGVEKMDVQISVVDATTQSSQ